MALLIDGPPSTIEDLTNQDSGLLDVCLTEQIDATVKLGLAHDELLLEIQDLVESQRRVPYSISESTLLDLGRVVSTTSIKQWHVWHTLTIIYRDAYFAQLNDRFKHKWKLFETLAVGAKQQFRRLGVGLVTNPIRRPSKPIVSLFPAAENGGLFNYTVTLLNHDFEQSSPADLSSIELKSGAAIRFQLERLPNDAAAWNLYVGCGADEVVLQNGSPLSVSEDYAFYPSTAAALGPGPGNGQEATQFRGLPQILQRG